MIKLLIVFGLKMKCDYKVMKLINWCGLEYDGEYNFKGGVYR